MALVLVVAVLGDDQRSIRGFLRRAAIRRIERPLAYERGVLRNGAAPASTVAAMRTAVARAIVMCIVLESS